jgi:hypothetical protein
VGALGIASLSLLVLMSVLAGRAAANSSQETIFQDDRSLLFSGDTVRERALDEIASLGSDTIHSLVFWGRIAPSLSSGGRPHFDASNPADYPPSAWDPYDDLVRGAQRRGLSVLLTPTGAIPPWASGCHGSLGLRQDCRPSPHEFGMFVQALARRYSGSYRDENEGGGILPRVRRWSIWNEPNQGGWLKPQYTRSHGRVVPASPYIYRELVNAGVRALRTSGHAHDEIMLGETAPIGRTRGRLLTRAMSPGVFYRELFCLDAHGSPLRGHAARLRPGCTHFRRPQVTGVSHHPYTVGAYRSPRSAAASDWVTVSTVDRLLKILDQAAHHHRLRRHTGIWYTELGYQTRPPDRFGVSTHRQAAYINESNWIAYRSRRVHSIAQYELFDEPEVGVFNTGLRFADGRPKPSLEAFRMPIWVDPSSRRVTVFGQVRPGSRGQAVRIQFRRRGGHYHTRARVVLRSSRGYFVRHFRARDGYWRLTWTPPGSSGPLRSRTARS